MADDMQKGIKEAVLGVALAASPMAAHAQKAPEAKVQTQVAPKPPEMKFDPTTLHPELAPIAVLESSFGKKMNHAPNSKGEFHTAIGALGFKPSTAFEEYTKSKHLQTLFPKLNDPKQFLSALRENPSMYNSIAASHWSKLKQKVGSAARAAFAWRWGRGAAIKADAQKVMADPYVQKYMTIAGQLGKSEALVKMAIADLKPGKIHKEKQARAASDNVKFYNYDHLLHPDRIKEGYSLSLKQNGPDIFESILDHNGEKIGYLDAQRHQQPALADHLTVQEANVKESHRGKRLGQAMYEAMYTHAKHKGGMKFAHGQTHSTLAHYAHSALARKHGLQYQGIPNYGNNSLYSHWENEKEWKQAPIGNYDERYAPYKYELKSEEDGSSSLSAQTVHDRIASIDTQGTLINIKPKIFQHPEWKLTSIPVAHLDLFDENDPARTADYASQSANSQPPIVAVPNQHQDGWEILDGTHRSHASIGRGDTHIKALVPSTYVNWNPTQKSEELEKMAIANYGVGKLVGSDDSGAESYDYTHVLPATHRQHGYRLEVNHDPNAESMSARLWHPDHPEDLGILHADVDKHDVAIGTADLADDHQGKGFGSAMYEALMAHGKNKLGRNYVSGSVHSTLASKTHQRISQKHGLDYKPVPTPFPHLASPIPGPYDNRYGPYKYALKNEELEKVIEDWVKSKKGSNES